jgi:nicotinamidase-related amidase
MPYVPPKKEERKIVFVVIDVQRKFTGGAIPEKGNKAEIETINKAASLFRKNGRPVIFVHYDGECECSEYKKSDGDRFLHGIKTDPDDVIVHKKHMNSFTNSRLAEVVKECGADSILIAGMVTQYCVIGTYYGAFESGISPYLLKGGVIASDGAANDAAYVLCKTFTIEEVEENLRVTKMPESSKICGTEHLSVP